MTIDVLIVDDELDIRDLISDILLEEGFTSRKASNSEEVFAELNKKKPHAIILDIWLQGSELDGLGILEVVKNRYPLIPVIVISGHGTIQTAVKSIKMGAYDYIEKPFNQEKLIIVLKRALENLKLKRENIDLKSRVIDKNNLIGNSKELCKLKTEIDKISNASSRIMIFGPVGCGKELVARMIHKKSNYSSGPFISFNPLGLSDEKISEEFFGEYDKDNKNNAKHFVKRLSILEAANNGTLYIDEITDASVFFQNKLLKVIQDQSLVKGNEVIKLNIRFISSTSHNIEELVDNDKFRQDLYYRLNVVTLKVPGLSKRKEDIPLLVQYFTDQLSKFSGVKPKKFSEESIAALQAYTWPGNIRQLRNVVEWALIMNYQEDEPLIKPNMLPSEITESNNTANLENNFDIMSLPLRDAREIFEKQYLTAQMSRFNNNISKTSVFVGMERSALHRKLKSLNICSNNKNNDDERREALEDGNRLHAAI